jgi:hypothetical protein
MTCLTLCKSGVPSLAGAPHSHHTSEVARSPPNRDSTTNLENKPPSPIVFACPLCLHTSTNKIHETHTSSMPTQTKNASEWYGYSNKKCERGCRGHTFTINMQSCFSCLHPATNLRKLCSQSTQFGDPFTPLLVPFVYTKSF